MEQLIKKNCNTGEYSNVYPKTVTSAITDDRTGEGLNDILNSLGSKFNHLYLPFYNGKRSTRLQVPFEERKKGLWVTYVSCNGTVVTEYYNSDDLSDGAWMDSTNWANCTDIKVLADDLEELKLRVFNNAKGIQNIFNLRGKPNGFAPLESNGQISSQYLPSYVDDVLEYNSIDNFPNVGERGKIYIDTSNNSTYRWSGTRYIVIGDITSINNQLNQLEELAQKINTSLGFDDGTYKPAYPAFKGKAVSTVLEDLYDGYKTEDIELKNRIWEVLFKNRKIQESAGFGFYRIPLWDYARDTEGDAGYIGLDDLINYTKSKTIDDIFSNKLASNNTFGVVKGNDNLTTIGNLPIANGYLVVNSLMNNGVPHTRIPIAGSKPASVHDSINYYVGLITIPFTASPTHAVYRGAGLFCDLGYTDPTVQAVIPVFGDSGTEDIGAAAINRDTYNKILSAYNTTSKIDIAGDKITNVEVPIATKTTVGGIKAQDRISALPIVDNGSWGYKFPIEVENDGKTWVSLPLTSCFSNNANIPFLIRENPRINSTSASTKIISRANTTTFGSAPPVYACAVGRNSSDDYTCAYIPQVGMEEAGLIDRATYNKISTTSTQLTNFINTYKDTLDNSLTYLSKTSEQLSHYAPGDFNEGQVVYVSDQNTYVYWDGTMWKDYGTPNTEIRETIKKDLFIDLWNKACGSFGTYNETTGFFELNGLTDITYDEALEIYKVGPINCNCNVSRYQNTNIRTNLPMVAWFGDAGTPSGQSFQGACMFRATKNIEVINLAAAPRLDLRNCKELFYGMTNTKLHTILGALMIGNNAQVFNCPNLVNFKFIVTNNINIDIHTLSKASLESIRYMATTKRDPISTATITVHPDIYAKLTDESNTEWNELLTKAAGRNISFATV